MTDLSNLKVIPKYKFNEPGKETLYQHCIAIKNCTSSIRGPVSTDTFISYEIKMCIIFQE